MDEINYEFTIILYDDTEIKRVVKECELEQTCIDLDNDWDCVWWDYEEI